MFFFFFGFFRIKNIHARISSSMYNSRGLKSEVGLNRYVAHTCRFNKKENTPKRIE